MRLRHLCLKALEHYSLRVKTVSFLVIATNTMFRIITQDGQRFVLRIYSDEETTLQHNLIEMFWLDAWQPVPMDVFDGYSAIRPIDQGFSERRDRWRLPFYLAAVALEGPMHLRRFSEVLDRIA